MTKEQLLRFIRIRNASEFDSNLQVGSDASECGFSVTELGEVKKVTNLIGPETLYQWETPYGTLQEKRTLHRNPEWSLIEKA